MNSAEGFSTALTRLLDLCVAHTFTVMATEAAPYETLGQRRATSFRTTTLRRAAEVTGWSYLAENT